MMARMQTLTVGSVATHFAASAATKSCHAGLGKAEKAEYSLRKYVAVPKSESPTTGRGRVHAILEAVIAV